MPMCLRTVAAQYAAASQTDIRWRRDKCSDDEADKVGLLG